MIKQKHTKKLLSLVTAALIAATLIQPVTALKAAEIKSSTKTLADYKTDGDSIYGKYDDVFEYSEGLAVVRRG